MAPRRTPKTRRPAAPRRSAPRPTRWAPPDGLRTATPYLSVRGADAALKFYAKAFGAKEVMRNSTPDGKIMHARMQIGNSIIMVSDEFGPPASSAGEEGPLIGIHLYLEDINAIWKRATAAGAKVEMPIDDTFWGERYGQLRDPYGIRWSLSKPVKLSPAVAEAKRKEAMAMMAGGAPP
jgi:PhnB protein